MSREILKIQDAMIFFKNFSGKPSDYNRQGDRNFSVAIPTVELAEQLHNDGWNVKLDTPDPDIFNEYVKKGWTTAKLKERVKDTIFYISVKVKYGQYPPEIWTKKGKKKTLLTEDTVASLDFAKIEKVDVNINPSKYDVLGKVGISAYLSSMYVTLADDPFESEFFGEDEEEEAPF